jgi:hypothetical protein
MRLMHYYYYKYYFQGMRQHSVGMSFRKTYAVFNINAVCSLLSFLFMRRLFAKSADNFTTDHSSRHILSTRNPLSRAKKVYRQNVLSYGTLCKEAR